MNTIKLKKVSITVYADHPPKYTDSRSHRYNLSAWRKDCVKKSRIYFEVAGENMVENFALRTVRPNDLYRTFLPDVFEKMGLPRTTKASWSQYAGCSMCPCSPGFVVQGGDKGRSAWATLEGQGAQVDPKKLKEKADEVTVRAKTIMRVAEGRG